MGRKTHPPIRTDADALLAAVWASPHEDLPRLVYADYIEERGEAARAEFIRLQIAREAAEAAGDDVSDGAWRREAELLASHRREWVGPNRGVRGRGDRDDFLRGFPARIETYTEGNVLARRGGRRSPRLRLKWTRPGGLALLLGTPAVRSAGELTLEPKRQWGAGEFAALAGPDRPDSITGLTIHGVPDGSAVRDWFAGLSLAKLHRLRLPGSQWRSRYVLDGLEVAPVAARLTDLDLRAVYLDGANARWLASTRAFPRLRVLRTRFAGPAVSPLIDLIASPIAAGLRDFQVPVPYHQSDAAHHTVAATPWPALKILRMSGRGLTLGATRALAQSAHLTGLRELHITFPRRTPEARMLKAAFGDRLRPADFWQNFRPTPPG